MQQIAKALLSILMTVFESKGMGRLKNIMSPIWNPSDPLCQKNIDKCLGIVDDFVLSNDELASNIDGIECFLMQSKHNSNNGRIRRSWMCFRRGMFFAQLLGFHRRSANLPPDETQRRSTVWKALYQGDRYMSLLLGLPYGTATRHCEMDPPVQTGAERYLFHLTNIMGDVIDRNLNPSSDGNYMETVRIEGEMMVLVESMSSEWWNGEFPREEELCGQIYPRLLPQVGYIRALFGPFGVDHKIISQRNAL